MIGVGYMSKYERLSNNFKTNSLDTILVEGETVIWSGKPKKAAFILSKICTMLPVALFWLLIDIFAIKMFTKGFQSTEMRWMLIIFFAAHLLPVWIWLSNVITASKRWSNTEYAVTDKRIIIMSGFIGMDYQTIYYTDIKKVHLNVSMIDKLLKVGDIYFDTKGQSTVAFLDLKDAYELYPKIQKVVLDIKTDIEFPNNLRPKENDGYNTKYNAKF